MCYPTEGLAQKQQSSLNTPSVSQSRNKNTKILEDAYISAKDVIDLEFESEDYLVKYMKKKKFRRIYKSKHEIDNPSECFSWEIWGYNIEYDDDNYTYKRLYYHKMISNL